jgi:hypothetical protein
VNATAGQTPNGITLVPYNGLSASFAFVAPLTGSATLTISDALNNGDVTPNTLPADNANTPYKYLVYFSFFNPGPQGVAFGYTPQVQLTNTNGFGGATLCEIDELALFNGASSPPTWRNLGASAPVSGNTVSVPATYLFGSSVTIQPGQYVIGIGCK